MTVRVDNTCEMDNQRLEEVMKVFIRRKNHGSAPPRRRGSGEASAGRSVACANYAISFQFAAANTRLKKCRGVKRGLRGPRGRQGGGY